MGTHTTLAAKPVLRFNSPDHRSACRLYHELYWIPDPKQRRLFVRFASEGSRTIGEAHYRMNGPQEQMVTTCPARLPSGDPRRILQVLGRRVSRLSNVVGFSQER